jgi:two-component system nitrate/nitrite response regulator NarL
VPLNPIAVFIVAPVRLYREGLRDALGDDRSIAVVGTAEAMQPGYTWQPPVPDILLLDMATPGALETIAELKRANSPIKVVSFAVREDEATIMACIEAGAAGYVSCDSSIEQIGQVINGVSRGELPCSPRVAAMFVRRLNMRPPAAVAVAEPFALSARERQVVHLIREGLSNKEIGHALHIAEATVKNHVHHLLEKLQVTTRTQALARLRKDSDYPDPEV